MTGPRAASYESGENKVVEVNSGRFSLGAKGYVMCPLASRPS